MRAARLAGLAVALACGRLLDAQPSFARATVGEAAPDFSLPDLDGRVRSLAAERGRIVLVDFWASWCAPCVEELACLDALGRRHPEDVRLLAVTIDRDAETARKFLRDRLPTADATVLHDGASAVLAEYGADGLPALYLVDRGGEIRALHDGAGGCREIEAELAELLREGAPVAPARPGH
jgi:thiol-disulfide isomerase/thioredoxin